MRTFFGYGWAQPVVSHRSAAWCSTLSLIARATGHRILNHRKHIAWQRACGLS